ncbi:class F sortase [Kribbella sp. NPDC051620]|uniref:class F sortase n=1 Tax=Kribbella sp. NPDC051620 TaxID=3364120 RepID=UPI0037A4F986
MVTTPPDKPGRRRRQGRRSPRWTAAFLAVGATLVVVGGYVQFRGGNSAADQGGQIQQSPSLTPRTPFSQSAPAAKPSAPATGAPTARPKKGATGTTEPRTRSADRAKSGAPVRVSVPRLGVSARVLGIRARRGALIPPSNPRLVGWWSEGARPGAAKGSAIITGHTVHNGGGAFDDLEELRAGDAVTVSTAKGTISYSVVAVAVYRKGALAKQAARLFDQAVPGRLVLVTCEDWDGSKYLSNAVVIAKPVG